MNGGKGFWEYIYSGGSRSCAWQRQCWRIASQWFGIQCGGILRRIPVCECGGKVRRTAASLECGDVHQRRLVAGMARGSSEVKEERWARGGGDINIWPRDCSTLGRFMEGIFYSEDKIPRHSFLVEIST